MGFREPNRAERLIHELQPIIEAIQIISSTSFLFGGDTVDASSSPPVFPGSSSPQNTLVAHLQQHLYRRCYISRFEVDRAETGPSDIAKEETFAANLEEANVGCARWDKGWQIEQVEPSGLIWSKKHGIRRTLLPGEFVNYEAPGVPIRPGMIVDVFLPKQSMAIQPGSYFAFGKTVLGTEDYDLVRFYWNLNSTGACRLIRCLTQELNRFQVPFRFKCPIRPASFSRCDSGVLYVNKRFYRIVYELVTMVYESVEPYLRPHVPLFTLPLMPGLGVAEDPGNGESFGMSRCRIVAEGIWQAHESGTEGEARVQDVVAQFTKYGLRFGRSYLNADSLDQYDAASSG